MATHFCPSARMTPSWPPRLLLMVRHWRYGGGARPSAHRSGEALESDFSDFTAPSAHRSGEALASDFSDFTAHVEGEPVEAAEAFR